MQYGKNPLPKKTSDEKGWEKLLGSRYGYDFHKEDFSCWVGYFLGPLHFFRVVWPCIFLGTTLLNEPCTVSVQRTSAGLIPVCQPKRGHKSHPGVAVATFGVNMCDFKQN